MRLACVQAPVEYKNPKANAFRAFEILNSLSLKGVDLAVFPEAFLTGYCADSREEAADMAIERNHPVFKELAQACVNGDLLAVIGFAEREGEGLYNSAVLLEPGVAPRFYRKTHLPFLGYDRFAERGESLEPFDTRLGRIGVLICYDLRPPEATRTLALKGADLIVLPTNWPVGAEVSAAYICVARAAENKVYFATCNRCGSEGVFRFIGRSRIISPTGEILAEAGEGEQTLIYEIDLSEARRKHTVVTPGEYEYDVIRERRPELYGALVEQPTI